MFMLLSSWQSHCESSPGSSQTANRQSLCIPWHCVLLAGWMSVIFVVLKQKNISSNSSHQLWQSTDQPHGTGTATSNTVTGPVGERLQAGTEDAPVLDRQAPLRHLHDSGAGWLRLSRHWRLILCRGGLRVLKQSPIQALTRHDVEYLC